jgi:hypothetical protein
MFIMQWPRHFFAKGARLATIKRYKNFIGAIAVTLAGCPETLVPRRFKNFMTRQTITHMTLLEERSRYRHSPNDSAPIWRGAWILVRRFVSKIGRQTADRFARLVAVTVAIYGD